MRCLTCDFGGSSVKYALVDNEAQIHMSGKLPAPLESVEEFVNLVGELYDEFYNQIEGIAISMPGYIDPEKGYLLGSGAYRQLYGKCIFDLLSSRCPVPIAIENDGKCAALSEVWKGSLADCKDGIVIILGSGIAGGIIKDGKIHSGRDYAAGELSYMIIDSSEKNFLGCACMSAAMYGLTFKTCKAKNFDIAIQDSAPILEWVDSMVNVPYANPDKPLKEVKVDGIQFFKWLSENDQDVVKIYHNFITALATVVQNVQLCLAPEKIIIGGGLSIESRIFKDLNEELENYYEALGIDRQLRANVEKSRYLDECNLLGATYNYLLRANKIK